MVHRIDIGLGPATTAERTRIVEQLVEQSWEQARPLLVSAIQRFLSSRVSPTTLLTFELSLVSAVRELGRALLAATLNSLEPTDPTLHPRDLMQGGIGFRRRNEKTANQNLATCFGTITLYRRGYRSWDGVERSIFPAEMLLGICHSTTPALRDWIGRFMADAGASQDAVVSWLKASLSVTMSVKRLRQVTEHLSDAMGELRQVHQVQRLLDLLREAGNSRGSRKPVLAVGRDGITLRQYANSLFEVATAATISVYDRAGKRLGTVYLAWPPELGQATMDQMLTDILLELFEEWTGPLPRLAYVSDCGSNESGYFEGILRKMRHPRTTDVLHWIRVVDYYHVSERIWAMATALFGKDTQHAWGWARRMLKALKKRNGPSRVLHSAASQRKKIKRMSQTRQDDFDKAINYLRPRTKFMRYHECSSNHIPIGSGVTEAACKTIYTQRLKLSGMRWSFEGAKSVVTLRTILLSKTWDATYADYLKSLYPADLQTYQPKRVSAARRAA